MSRRLARTLVVCRNVVSLFILLMGVTCYASPIVNGTANGVITPSDGSTRYATVRDSTTDSASDSTLVPRDTTDTSDTTDEGPEVAAFGSSWSVPNSFYNESITGFYETYPDFYSEGIPGFYDMYPAFYNAWIPGFYMDYSGGYYPYDGYPYGYYPIFVPFPLHRDFPHNARRLCLGGIVVPLGATCPRFVSRHPNPNLRPHRATPIGTYPAFITPSSVTHARVHPIGPRGPMPFMPSMPNPARPVPSNPVTVPVPPPMVPSVKWPISPTPVRPLTPAPLRVSPPPIHPMTPTPIPPVSPAPVHPFVTVPTPALSPPPTIRETN